MKKLTAPAGQIFSKTGAASLEMLLSKFGETALPAKHTSGHSMQAEQETEIRQYPVPRQQSLKV